MRSSTPKVSMPVRSLTISKPQKNDSSVSTSLKSNIILVSKYAFQSESQNELSVKKGEILKLLNRQGDGWLLVKFIDRMEKPGLVPAKYVDIAINDSAHPITLNWLHGRDDEDKISNFVESNYFDLQIKELLKRNSPLTINNKPYPIGASITKFLLYNNRYWYRLDIVYSDQSYSFLCRYYESFYNLHLTLLERLSLMKVNEKSVTSLKLPKLPQPIPANERENGVIKTQLKRCSDLDFYINSLISNDNYQCAEPLLKWLEISYNDLPGISFNKDDTRPSDEEINDQILSGSIDIWGEHLKTKKKKEEEQKSNNSELEEEKNCQEDNSKENADSEKNISELVDLPKRTKSVNTYNHYQQIDKVFKVPPNAPRTPNLKLSSEVSVQSKDTSNDEKAPSSSTTNALTYSHSMRQSPRLGRSSKIERSPYTKQNPIMNSF